MNDVEYNLLDEKWLVARREDGTTGEYSLLEVFEHAHELRSLSGELPVQNVAILRLLIAVVETVYQSSDENGVESEIEDAQEALRRWKAIWDAGSFDMGLIGSYLERYRGRFYLFHPDRPFYQAPIGKGTSYGVSKLNGELSESENKPRLFTSVNGVNKEVMGYAEAARWLLFINGFDDTSSKPSVRGVGMPSTGAGWLGKMGLVYIEGKSLFETILLNMVLLSYDEEPFPKGVPTWEPVDADVRERVEIDTPESPVEILTLQSRRLLLLRSDEGVTGYRLLGGDIVEKEGAFVEQMTVWRLTKENRWIPQRHDPSRVMWRDFSSLLIKGGQGRDIREPGAVRWASRLVEEGFLSDREVTIRTVGAKYADNDFYIDDYVSDSLTVNRELLDKAGEAWNYRIAELISTTDECVGYLGTLASDIAKLNGLRDAPLRSASQNAKAVAYYSLDNPFRSWLRSVEPSSQDFDDKSIEWKRILERVLMEQGRGILFDAGDKAIVGKDGDNAIRFFRFFKGRLFKKTRRSVER